MVQTADVIPIANLPRGKDCYTYRLACPQTAAAGQLVKIPFRRRLLWAVVWATSSKPSAESLKDITHSGPQILTNEQLLLVDRIWAVYGGSRSHILHALVTVGRCLNLEPSHKRKKQSLPPATLHIQSLTLQQSFLRTLPLPKRAQALIVAPTAEQAVASASLIRPRRPVWTLTPQTTISQVKTVIQELQQNPVAIIVGTRRSLLLPYKNLKTIILIDEHHPAHVQWDLEPRIDNRIVARWLAEIWGARLHYCSPMPTLGTWAATPTVQYAFGTPPARQQADRLQFWAEPVTNQQQWCQWITAAIAANGSILIIASPFQTQHALCRSCATIARCCLCSRAVEVRGSRWHCLWCNTAIDQTDCPQCRGVSFRVLPSAPELIRTIIGQYLPELEATQYSIVQPPSLAHWAEQRRLSPSQAREAILVWDLAGSIPAGYTQTERGKQITAILYESMTTHPNAVIAVCNTPLEWQRAHSIDEMRGWYQSELLQRQQFRYPPHYPIILLDRHATNRNNSSDMDSTLQTLRSVAHRANAQLLGPYTSRTRRKGFTNRVVLILRSQIEQPFEQFSSSIIPSIPTGWSITVNPEYIPQLI